MTKRIDRYEATVGTSVVVATRSGAERGVQAIDRAKSTFEVRVGGELRGMLVLPHGFGKPWQAWAFGSIVRPAWDNDRPRVLNGYGKPGCGHGPESLLARFPAWKDEGLAPTPEELAAFVAQVAEDRRVREEDDARRFEASKVEEAERKARERAERATRLASLESLRTRLASALSNEEIAALEDVTAAIRAEIAADASREAYWADVKAERERA